jgi:cullin 1
MYSLLNRIPEGLSPLREKFETHVKKMGLEFVERIGDQVSEDGEKTAMVHLEFLML